MSNDTFSRRDFLKLIGAGSATLAMGDRLLAAESAGKSAPSNIVLILADDLGYGELGCQGNKEIPTPNIDSIAAAGVRFTSGYVSCPVCSPTRAGLMTGRYQQRFGHEFNPGPSAAANFGLPLTETTLASRLKAAGYATCLVGKWHLGNREGYRPLERGFDEFFGFLGGAHSYIDNKDRGIMRGNEVIDEKEYLTDALSREAVSFIDRNKQKPFFLYLAFNAVHAPLQAPEKYLSRFSAIKDQKRRTFAAMLSAMDDAVGSVLASLRKNGLESNTLVVFHSDNGGPTPSTTSQNGPLRGFKGQVYEGGTRVAFMMQWKGQVPSGKTIDQPVISLDVAPTALAAAQAQSSGARFDGVDLLPLVTGKAASAPHDALYWRFGDQHAIRKGDWKLVKTAAGGSELFDLSADIGEKTNLAVQKPDKLKELDDQLAKWESELPKPLWQRAPGPRQQRRPRQQRQKAAGQTT